VHPAITTFDESGNPSTLPSPVIPQSVLAVDIAANANGNDIAIVAAGSDKVIRTSVSNIAQESSPGFVNCSSLHTTLEVPGSPVAVSFWGDKLVAQTREPAAIYVLSGDGGSPIMLPGNSVADTGHNLFHREASSTSAIACASCHPEGSDDGHTWVFDSIGQRRTQRLGGDLFDTAPFHWDGDMSGLGAIMDEVFVNRMGGTRQGPRHVSAMERWMGTMPTVPISLPNASDAQIKHGADLFVKAGCQTCHSGSMFTNNQNADVGTGKAFQVPSLIGVGNRAPYLHDGCAATLKDRFGPCGGGDKHGHTSDLSEADIDDLVAYLETL
jgi:cytochrome c553